MKIEDVLQLQEAQSKVVDEAIQQGLVDGGAELLADEESHLPHAMNKKALKERYKAELTQGFDLYKKRIETGISQLLGALGELKKQHSDVFLKTPLNDIAKDLGKIVAYSLGLQKKQEEFMKNLEKGTSLQEICGMSSNTLNVLYQAAKHLYDHEQYNEASDAFAFLCMLNGTLAPLWMGFANSEYLCGRYEQALYGYAIAFQMDPEDLDCHVASAKCYEEIHQIDNAVNALELALLVIEEKNEFADVKQYILQEKQRLKKMLSI